MNNTPENRDKLVNDLLIASNEIHKRKLNSSSNWFVTNEKVAEYLKINFYRSLRKTSINKIFK